MLQSPSVLKFKKQFILTWVTPNMPEGKRKGREIRKGVEMKEITSVLPLIYKASTIAPLNLTSLQYP